MTKYDDTQKRVLLSTPIEEVMSYFGKSTKHDRYGMYFSPYRSEENMSFHVDSKRNIWYDFGLAEGGGVIDLVIRLSHCKREEAFDILAGISSNMLIAMPSKTTRTRKKRKGIIIGSIQDNFRKEILVKYAKDRGISSNILARYCREIAYIYRDYPSKEYYAIGFQNRSGGYVLRSYSSKKSTSSDVSLIGARGEMISEPETPVVMLFEGFFDFLSWLELRGQETPGCDCCILNSVGNINRAIDFISGHQMVEVYLDNDQAGNATLKKLEDCLSANAEKVCVYDMRSLYESFKDLNERLVNEVGGHLCSTNYTKHHGTNNFKGCPGETGQNQLG